MSFFRSPVLTLELSRQQLMALGTIAIVAAPLCWLVSRLAGAEAVAVVVTLAVAVAFLVGSRAQVTEEPGGERLNTGYWREQRERARRLAIHADTPWVFNRWYFEFRVREEIQRCKRYGFQLAVLLIRLEYGKELDMELAESRLMRLLSTGLRPFDVPARLSAGNYGICLIQCDAAGAAAVLQRLGLDREFQAATGVAVYASDGEDQNVLMRIAEDRLEAQATAA
jgi:GGDEF domain-containing protein